MLDSTFFNYSNPNSCKRKRMPEKLVGKQMWRRYTNLRKTVVNGIIPVWRDNLCFDTFPSGKQLKDFLKQVMRAYVKDSDVGSSDEGELEDDAPTDSSRIITTPAPSHGTRSFALYAPSQLAESPVTSMGNITSDTPTAEIDVPMPPEWVVFVKFGPPANADCDPMTTGHGETLRIA